MRENENPASNLTEPDAEEMAQTPERFTDEDYRDADTLLEGISPTGALISEVLTKARSKGHAETLQTLVYLLALRDFGEVPANAEYLVEPSDRCFLADPFWGDDLFIRPSVLPQEEGA